MALKRITSENGEVYFVNAKTGQRVEVDSKYTNTKSQSKSRFETLLGLGRFISAFGWIIFIIGIVGVLIGIFGLASNDFTFKSIVPFIIMSGMLCLINGILVVAVGELLSCFVSLEHNTYETNNLLKSLLLFYNKDSK